ncbi:MAG: YcnI family protein, partial [Nitriliruptorales bacterium]
MHTLRRLLTVAMAAAAALAMLAGPAAAHLTVNPETAPEGFTAVTFRVPHGCEDGQPTTTVRVQIPETVVSVKPEFIPEWEVSTTMGPLEEAVNLHGEEITEHVAEVVWTGPEIPDDQFAEFGLSIFIAAEPGETLYFPAIQECPGGAETAWIQIPSEGRTSDDLEKPAPALTVTAGEEDVRAVGASVLDPIGLTAETAAIAALLLGLLALAFGVA